VEYVDGERRNIDQLRKKLKNDHIVSFFKNVDELSGLVSAALSNLISDNRKLGKDMEEVPADLPVTAKGTRKTAKKKRVEPVDNKPPPGPVTKKKEIPRDKNEDFLQVQGAKKVYKNRQGFMEADFGDGIIMVYIPPGEFNMGSNDYDNEEPLHTVYLDGYWMGKYEVTFNQYDRYCDENGKAKPYDEGWGRGKRPVINVSWNDANAYCRWLSKKTGLPFKLPTEAQWEKAARGTDSRKYPWGSKKLGGTLANFGRKIKKTTSVDSYPKGVSPYGLLDMAGNVWEWCRDWWSKRYYKSSPDKNPTGPKSGTYRVMRGGSWSSEAVLLRCSNRNGHKPSNRNSYVGFRLCQDD